MFSVDTGVGTELGSLFAVEEFVRDGVCTVFSVPEPISADSQAKGSADRCLLCKQLSLNASIIAHCTRHV